MAQAQQVASAQVDLSSRDMTIILGYPIVAVVRLLAIYLAASGRGREAGDFANTIAFP
jgi:hypothetical protein